MPLFKFEDFIFDSSRYSLTQKGKQVAIRPKALKLLSFLIVNRHKILSKAEIMSEVWGSDYARDHVLFQLIGELRKHPLKSEFVRTHPNEGYQWNVATKIISHRSFIPPFLATSAIAALACLSVMTLTDLNKSEELPIQTEQLPAFGALSKGILALENGEQDRAVHWFEFALIENPDSVESSIFLAETLYQLNRPDESAKYLITLLEKENLTDYNKATAMNILSRISEQQGQFSNALSYARKSMQSKGLGQCSQYVFEQRFQRLENEIMIPPADSEAAPKVAKEKVLLSKNYISQCNELKGEPAEIEPCLPLSSHSVIQDMAIKKSILRVT